MIQKKNPVQNLLWRPELFLLLLIFIYCCKYIYFWWIVEHLDPDPSGHLKNLFWRTSSLFLNFAKHIHTYSLKLIKCIHNFFFFSYEDDKRKIKHWVKINKRFSIVNHLLSGLISKNLHQQIPILVIMLSLEKTPKFCKC